MTDKRAIVFGATGTQARAVAAALIADGWSLQAVTRDPAGPAAEQLRRMGATPVPHTGDIDGLARLMNGAALVVSIQAALTDRWNSREAVEGMAIALAAKVSDVRHFIQHSAIVADARGVLGMGSKRAIEERIAEIGLPATIVRPSFFMENLITYFPLRIEAGRLTLAAPLPPRDSIEMVCANDIGQAVASVAEDADSHIGQSYDLIGDVLTMREMADAVGELSGRPTTAQAIPADALTEGWPQGVPLFRWIIERGTHGDASHLQKLVAKPTSFRAWAATTLLPVLPVG